MVERNVFPQFVLVGEASGDFAEGANKHFALFSGWRGGGRLRETHLKKQASFLSQDGPV